ncbi:MAG: hypothetical protein ACLFVQ_01915 [Chitinispirillaceae bacterium]
MNRNPHEAVGTDEMANIIKVLYLYEASVVYAAGISVKAGAQYPGRSVGLPGATVVARP